MKRIALLLLCCAALESCGAMKLPRRPGGGRGGQQPGAEQPERTPPRDSGGGRTSGGASGSPASLPQQEPVEPPPLPPAGTTRPEIAPRPDADLTLPEPQQGPLPDWLEEEVPAVDFRVDFGGEATPVPSGLYAGINDMLQGSAGAWQVWGQDLPKDAGLARLWLRYHRTGLNQEHFRAARQAMDAGLAIYLTAVGGQVQEDRGHGYDKDRLHAVKPSEVEAWCRMVAGDVEKLRQRGIDVRYVEIWNEPEYNNNWDGSDEEFAAFFARAGRGLRKMLPEGIRIGGPSMGAGYGGGRRLFRLILKACVHEGFEPDFLSWHDYPGIAADQEVAAIPAGMRRLANASGLTIPEFIVSEWQLSMPVNPALEDHRGAAAYVGMINGMAQTELRNSMFFFLQDGNWESKSDFDGGHSLGVFTLNGAPKALLSAVRLVRLAASLPKVPQQRAAAPVNLSLLATREGSRGFLLAANSDGQENFTAKKLAETLGVDLSDYSGKDRQLARYMKGEVDYSQLRAPARDERVWKAVQRFMASQRRERADDDRRMRIELRDGPARVGRVWLIDERHGNPKGSRELREDFAPYAEGLNQVAAKAARKRLLAEGVTQTQLEALSKGMRDGDQRALASVPAELRKRAQEVFDEERARLDREVAPKFAAYPAASAAEVDAEGRAELEGGVLEVLLPVGTTVLVEVLWEGADD